MNNLSATLVRYLLLLMIKRKVLFTETEGMILEATLKSHKNPEHTVDVLKVIYERN